jgi:hypothetical protein
MNAAKHIRRHHPRRRMIQYAATFVFNRGLHGILDRPVKPNDDGCVVDSAP